MSRMIMSYVFENRQGSNTKSGEYTQMTLMNELEKVLEEARPRLLRLARSQGVALEEADDVVQETLVEAWRHLDYLRATERFDAWLNGICRNVCRRWVRADSLLKREGLCVFSAGVSETEGELLDIEDPVALDPAEALDQQDLAVLVDRALGYLSGETRELLEMCYLVELPQREAALRLGMTITALESRLHRARRQLRQVLSNELRADAESLGLAMDNAPDAGWRETREWCMFCGRHRMLGAFEPLADNQINLHMRCPGCSSEVNSGGAVPLGGLRSFHPAFKRLIQYATGYFAQLAVRAQPMLSCVDCGMLGPMRIVGPGEYSPWHGLTVLMECASCGSFISTSAGSCVLAHAAAQRFTRQHPRWVYEPETLVEFTGQAAIRVGLVDVIGAERVTFFVCSRTLQVMAVF